MNSSGLLHTERSDHPVDGERTERIYINDIGELLRGKNKQSISCRGKVRVHWRVGKKIVVDLAPALQIIQRGQVILVKKFLRVLERRIEQVPKSFVNSDYNAAREQSHRRWR